MSHRYSAGYTLLAVLLSFLVLSLLAYRTMEHLQERNDQSHGFSEEDALLALPQFRLVDTSGNLIRTLISNEPSKPAGNHTYLVLAGSFTRKDKATEHLVYLKKKGLRDAELLHFRGERDIHAIAVGKHRDIEAARHQVDDLKREYGMEAYVHKVRHDQR